MLLQSFFHPQKLFNFLSNVSDRFLHRKLRFIQKVRINLRRVINSGKADNGDNGANYTDFAENPSIIDGISFIVDIVYEDYSAE